MEHAFHYNSNADHGESEAHFLLFYFLYTKPIYNIHTAIIELNNHNNNNSSLRLVAAYIDARLMKTRALKRWSSYLRNHL